MNDKTTLDTMIDPAIITAIGSARIVPVLRFSSTRECVSAAEQLLDGGLPMVEVAATTPDWRAVVTRLRATYPHASIGVGTILRVQDGQAAIGEGADFLVSPRCDSALRSRLGRYLIEGGLSPTEVFSAAEYGAAKLFPAHVGGVRYLRSLRAVYPDAKIMPTGGVDLAMVRDWLSAGAFAVGVGSDLTASRDPAAAVRAALADQPETGNR